MKILLSWSSGKDSAWALHLLNRQYPGAVAGLLTTVNETMDRVAMHGVRRSVLDAQARATGLPLQVVKILHPCPNEIYEAAMRTAVAEACADGFTHAAIGDLFLEDIRRYREDRLAGTGLGPLFPVGHSDVIVASWCGKAVRKERIAARPGWDRVAAVRDGHIYEIKSAFILPPGPASLTEGLRQLNEILMGVRLG